MDSSVYMFRYLSNRHNAISSTIFITSSHHIAICTFSKYRINASQQQMKIEYEWKSKGKRGKKSICML